MFERLSTNIPNNIFVVGCGGTGSRLVPLLAQFIKSLSYVLDPKIFLFDFDVVEAKNLVRQNFIKPDIGKNKALVLAERYGRAFDMNIIPVQTKVKPYNLSDSTNVIQDLSKAYPLFSIPRSALIIMCVDSAQGRRDVISGFQRINAESKPLYIDSGNEDGYGQVIMFDTHIMYPGSGVEEATKMLPSFIPCKQRINTIPCDVEFYHDMVDLPGGSCANLDQTLAINSLMASTIMGMVQNMYYSKPMNYNRINVTLDGCSFPNVLSVGNYSKLAIANPRKTNEEIKKFQAIQQMYRNWCFYETRLDDVLFEFVNSIEKEKKLAQKAADAAKAKAAKTEKAVA